VGANTMKRPATADKAFTTPTGASPTRQRERQAGDPVTLDNMTKREKQKYDDAMMMSENDAQLSLMVVNLKATQTNHWKEHIQSTANKDLQSEWKAINSIGYGNQKVPNLG
jgi:hypothetical protein